MVSGGWWGLDDGNFKLDDFELYCVAREVRKKPYRRIMLLPPEEKHARANQMRHNHSPLPTHSYRYKPTQKLNIWVRSVCALTIGKPKSRAIGTGPSIGTVMRRPKPAATR